MVEKMFSNKQLRALIVPLIIEQVLTRLVGMVDTIMISGAGEAAISGVSIVNEINYLLIVLLTSLATGGAVIVAQYIGAGDGAKADICSGQLVTMTVLVSSALTLFCVSLDRQILGVLYGSIENDVMEAAVLYFWITSLSLPFLGIYNSLSALFRSMNRTSVTMYVSIVMNIINIVGNYIGVYILHMGVAGVAWPTLISRIVSAVMMCLYSSRPGMELKVQRRNIFLWQPSYQRRIMHIAVPNSIENGLFQCGRVIVTSFIAGYGTVQIAANGVANSISSMGMMTDGAMQLAIVTVIGQCVGAGDYEQAKYFFRKMLRIAVLLCAADWIVCALFMPTYIPLFHLGSETSSLVMKIIRGCAIVSIPLHSVAFVFPNGLRSSGDVRYTLAVGVSSMFCARVFGAYMLGTIMGIGVNGIWIAMYIDWVVRTIFFVTRYRSGKWTRYRAI